MAGNTLINSAENFNLIASNMIAGNNATIIANNNLNITDSKNTASSSSYNKNLNIDSGVIIYLPQVHDK